jgi:CheY-like chemotaxis protein
MQVQKGAAAVRQSGPWLNVVFQAEGKDGGARNGGPLRIDGHQVRVLVVEDDALIAMDLSVSVSQLGGDVVDVATTANDAMRMVSQLHPDVVLMDVRLRGEPDGVEAAQIIQARGATPIIFVTGNSDQETLRRMAQLGGAQVILKPVLISELRDAIIRAYSH